jgi:hypothetical protein
MSSSYSRPGQELRAGVMSFVTPDRDRMIRAGVIGGLVGGVVIWIYEAIVWVGVQHPIRANLRCSPIEMCVVAGVRADDVAACARLRGWSRNQGLEESLRAGSAPTTAADASRHSSRGCPAGRVAEMLRQKRLGQ